VNTAQQHENLRTLASLLGIRDEEAAPLLTAKIQITWNILDPVGAALGEFIATMLTRTFTIVGTASQPAPDASYELVVNGAKPISARAVPLYAEIDEFGFRCGRAPGVRARTPGQTPTILTLLSACFAAAQLANYALNLPQGFVVESGVELDFALWPGVPTEVWTRNTGLGRLQLAGAGAVGNALAYALQYLPVTGDVAVIDPKKVTGGIINRCLWFDSDDIDRGKAHVLSTKANLAFGHVKFTPYETTVQKAREQLGQEFNCLLVGVDSRLARRQLQAEIPFEVFDASTTGVEEVVFHHNAQLTGRACLACVYAETDAERSYGSHVADTLNVTSEDLAQGYISPDAAGRIVARYPQLCAANIVGLAFDSLFKSLCATQELVTTEQKQVLAPFAFVSQLAGTVLAIELFLRRQDPARPETFNYWRINPWRGITVDLQQSRPARSDCSVCSADQYGVVARGLWARGNLDI
jgi:molybdopterin/thiamine biosynthesis adenylyltransferase